MSDGEAEPMTTIHTWSDSGQSAGYSAGPLPFASQWEHQYRVPQRLWDACAAAIATRDAAESALRDAESAIDEWLDAASGENP
jgi:hypothetical protein